MKLLGSAGLDTRETLNVGKNPLTIYKRKKKLLIPDIAKKVTYSDDSGLDSGSGSDCSNYCNSKLKERRQDCFGSIGSDSEVILIFEYIFLIFLN